MEGFDVFIEHFVEFNRRTKMWEVYDGNHNLLAKDKNRFEARVAAMKKK